MVKVGDEVYLEQCWEDDAGIDHDEYVQVTRIYPDGRCRFHLLSGYPQYRREKIQAWINKFDFYAKDLEPLAEANPQTPKE